MKLYNLHSFEMLWEKSMVRGGIWLVEAKGLECCLRCLPAGTGCRCLSAAGTWQCTLANLAWLRTGRLEHVQFVPHRVHVHLVELLGPMRRQLRDSRFPALRRTSVQDTKCLIGWSCDTIVIAFRGTASLANVASDLQVTLSGMKKRGRERESEGERTWERRLVPAAAARVPPS